jgi:uncharacterized membrane protein
MPAALTTSTEAATPSRRPRTIEPIAVALAGGFLLCLALAGLNLETLAGLPAHPLLLHVPVVLIPILAGATVALMAKPEWRLRYGLAWAAVALVTMAFTILAAGAGEAFRASRPIFASAALNEHAELGDQLKAVVVLFSAGIVGVVISDHLRDSGLLGRLAQLVHRPPIFRAVRLGLSLLAVVALVWVVRTGHEGAEVAWSQPSPLHAQK